jgi:hypothetical protein
LYYYFLPTIIPANQMTLPYDPNRLLDEIQSRLKAKNDAALARTLSVQPPLISKMRHRRMPVGAALLLRIHEETGLSIRELQYLLGDRRRKYRISDADGKLKTRVASSGRIR